MKIIKKASFGPQISNCPVLTDCGCFRGSR